MPLIRVVTVAFYDGADFVYFKPESQVTLNNLAADKGFPLIGLFIAGSGSAPDFILERSSFPTQIGANREDKLQNALDALLADTYKSPVDAADRFFWAVTHIYQYRADKLYEPNTDFKLYVSDSQPPGNWWQL